MNQETVDNRARSAPRAQPKQTACNSKVILPPYGAVVDKYQVKDELIICTGSSAWDRAKSRTWFGNTPKLVLPLNEPPDRFRWPVLGRYVMVFGFGHQDTYQRLIKLSQCLLKQGAVWVLWVMPGYPMTKIERRNREVAA